MKKEVTVKRDFLVDLMIEKAMEKFNLELGFIEGSDGQPDIHIAKVRSMNIRAVGLKEEDAIQDARSELENILRSNLSLTNSILSNEISVE